MVYTETIKLEDKVSDDAKHAAKTVDILSKSLANVQSAMVKAMALGDMKGFNKLATQHTELQSAIGGVDKALLKEMDTARKADEEAKKGEKARKAAAEQQKTMAAQTTANMAKVKVAMAMGREAVGQAIAGMRKAFTSLAAGDVKGAIEGVTQSVAGIAKMLDLVVPGLGQAASAIITIAGGLAGVTAGLIKEGAEFALVTNDVAGEMAAMKKGFKENIANMFKGINIKPFVGEMKGLFEIFDESKPSGQAMKQAIGGAFNAIFAVLTKVVPIVKHFFLDIVILSLKAYIAVKPLIKGIQDFAKSAEGSAMISKVMNALGVALKVAGAAMLFVVVAALALGAAFVAIVVAVVTLSATLLAFIGETAVALGAWIASASTAAYDFISGLVNGITSGTLRVVSAVKGMATSAISAVTSTLKIGSPSLVMKEKGLDTAEGMAGGIDAGASQVEGASTGMANAAVKGASAPTAQTATATKAAGAQITVMVQIDGAGKSALEITEEMVAAVFNRMALEAGV